MNVGLSSTLAFIIGALLPILGVVRNWTMTESDPAAFFADLMAGGLLLFGAAKTRQRVHTGQRFLSAAWGLTFGLLYSNLIAQLGPSPTGIHAEADIPNEWLIIPTIAGLLVAFVGLLASLRSTRPQ